ncbi:MAG: Type 1 glutamine amidotransferase-like domain-containing protein [Flavobacteriales bacterium]
MKRLVCLVLLLPFFSTGQNYTSYFLGNSTNIVTTPKGGVCLMGGASEHDNAMRWFLQQANGGDVLVLRATGSNGYNDYMLNQLGVNINSVETIVCHNASASQDTYIHEKIKQAEAIWFAGGDQWIYISYWRDTPIDSLINKAINERKTVVGGTSAGMAILGGFYFSAQNGTVTSSTALNNPFNAAVTVSNEPFLQNQFLGDVITDTHYDNPDRRGRHVVFLSRIMNDYQASGKGIACEEYTAVCMDTLGFCKIYGEYPVYDEDIYFIQLNCELTDGSPESCTASTPLTWNRGGSALKVYRAKGTLSGTQTFDLSDWKTGTGGVWEHWYVDNGVLTVTAGTAPDCATNSLEEFHDNDLTVYPNPSASGVFQLGKGNYLDLVITAISGASISFDIKDNEISLGRNGSGIYFLTVTTEFGAQTIKLVVGD